MPGTNTLVYNENLLITGVKSFITLVPQMSMLSEIIFNAGGGKRQSVGQWKMFKA